MKKILIGLMIITLMALAPLSVAEDLSYENRALGDTSITLDGDPADWEDVEGLSLTLTPARDEFTGSRDAVLKAAHDDSKIYFLVEVVDKYHAGNLDTISEGNAHHASPALAMAFPIADGSDPRFMGGTDRSPDDKLNTTLGEIDIVHWEMETKPGVKTSGAKGADTGDGPANLDDEYATTPWDRHDDGGSGANNLWALAWSHSAGYDANGTDGSFFFELSRDLSSDDAHDANFAEGESITMAIAFWSPNNAANDWDDDEHFTSSDDVITMELVSKAVGAPGFGLPLALVALFVAVPVLRRRK